MHELHWWATAFLFSIILTLVVDRSRDRSPYDHLPQLLLLFYWVAFLAFGLSRLIFRIF